MFGHDKFSTKITTYFVKDLIALYNSRNYLIAYAIHSVELITVTRPRPTTTRLLVTATTPSQQEVEQPQREVEQPNK